LRRNWHPVHQKLGSRDDDSIAWFYPIEHGIIVADHLANFQRFLSGHEPAIDWFRDKREELSPQARNRQYRR
jgi:hypothetical protein